MSEEIKCETPKQNKFIMVYGSSIFIFIIFIFTLIAFRQLDIYKVTDVTFGLLALLYLFSYLIIIWAYFYNYPISIRILPNKIEFIYKRKSITLDRSNIKEIFVQNDLWGNKIYIVTYAKSKLDRRVVFNSEIGENLLKWHKHEEKQ